MGGRSAIPLGSFLLGIGFARSNLSVLHKGMRRIEMVKGLNCIIFFCIPIGMLSLACSESRTVNPDQPQGEAGLSYQKEGSYSVPSHEDGDNDSQLDSIPLEGGVFSSDFDSCAAVTETALNTRGPADVIIAIDNTPSMANEIEEVRANMNRLSEMVSNQGLDLNIILISCFSENCLKQSHWHTICIDPPVGAEGACGESEYTDDSNLPNYLHVDESIESVKALENIVSTHKQWEDMIRDNSAKHVVVVSDDNDYWSAVDFHKKFTALDKRLNDYQFHGIFAYLGKEDACGLSLDDPCCTYSAPDGEGVVYKELVEETNGVSGNLCLQDFDPVFDELAGAVVTSARLNCQWDIPDPPSGMTLDPNLVNVVYLDGTGNSFLIGRVRTAEECSKVEQAWYYDDQDHPRLIHVCPQTCDWIQESKEAQIDIQFGCNTLELLI